MSDLTKQKKRFIWSKFQNVEIFCKENAILMKLIAGLFIRIRMFNVKKMETDEIETQVNQQVCHQDQEKNHQIR